MMLFIAEVHAVEENSYPIEIKTLDPTNWGLRTMFRMISSGSPELCRGERDGWVVKNVSLKSLSDVAEYSLKHSVIDVSSLQKNIMDGMGQISSMLEGSGLYKVTFNDRSLEVVPEYDTVQCALLPPSNIVEQLIKSDSFASQKKRRLSNV